MRYSVLSLAALLLPASASADTIVLYSNDFESPNVTPAVNCGNSLDIRTINDLYGTDDFSFAQTNTVEAVFLDDPAGLYSNPSGQGGLYAVGMLSTHQDDHLALTFDAGQRPFVNVGLDLSSIDVQGCGGPFGTAAPRMRVSVLDSPGGAFGWGNTELDAEEIAGTSAPDSWTFDWSDSVVALDISGATDGHISVVFDLLESGYAAFDNLTITASTEEGVVDTDLDGTADDTDNCVTTPNEDQADADEDGVGDVCDPCPQDAGPGDSDGDDVCDSDDLCLGDDASGDSDGDGVCDDRDACEGDDAAGDEDGDGVCDDQDLCAGDDAQGDADGDGFCGDRDCADDAESVFPGAEELCDGLDTDCDGELPADEADADGDGVTPCAGDCDDAAAEVGPGAEEVCNEVDDDCDGTIDPADLCTEAVPDCTCSRLDASRHGSWALLALLPLLRRRRRAPHLEASGR